jgi:hypothetical protein
MRNPLKNLYRRVVAPVADILQAKNIGKIKIPLNRWNERSRNQLNCYEKRLWKAGGHVTWKAYLKDAVSLSTSQADRLIKASLVMTVLSTPSADGAEPPVPVLPHSESLVRELIPLRPTGQEKAGWNAALEKAGGGQPTAKLVKEMVLEILHPGGKEGIPPNRTQRRRELITQLRTLVDQQESWDEVRNVLTELADII